METEIDLPPEFAPLLSELADTPEKVRAIWRYALVLMMIDDEKARFINAPPDGQTKHLVVETLTGERFSIVRPSMSAETEQFLLEHIRQIVEEDKSD